MKDNPNLKLKAYCEEVGVDYRMMICWTSNHGMHVSSLKADNAKSSVANTSTDNPAFVQFVPRPGIQPTSSSLRGVSIMFPDGVNLTLQECNTESVIGLLATYQQRKAMASTPVVAKEAE